MKPQAQGSSQALGAVPSSPAPTGAPCPPAQPSAHVLQLVEGVLKASLVVCRALGHHALHVLLEHLLVPDVGLHQVLEARYRLRLFIELGGEMEGSGSQKGDRADTSHSSHSWVTQMCPVSQGGLKFGLGQLQH